ncbi:MAG TPA: DUF2934 domain-containing protein [Geminicoccaceae bacterium]|nr:DUF2934 domain-containing protein [Geminicoccaceae bacterium]
MTDREQRIRNRAFELWERAGRPEGRQAEHWQEAEREIREEEERTGAHGMGLAEPAAAYQEEMPEPEQGLPDGDPARAVKGEEGAPPAEATGTGKGAGKGGTRRRRAAAGD